MEESQPIQDAATPVLHAGQKQPSSGTQNKEVAMNDDDDNDQLDHQMTKINDAEQIQQSSNLVLSPDVTVSLYRHFTILQMLSL